MYRKSVPLLLGLILSITALVSVTIGGYLQTESTLPESYQRPRGPINDDPHEIMLWRGIDAMYSERFQEAEAILDSVMTLDSSNLVAPLVAVGNQWQKSLTEESYEASYETMLQAIDTAIPRYEAMLTRDGDRAEVLLYLGSTYGLRTRIYLAEKSWLAGLYSGLKGWGMIKDAYELDSTLTDACLPIGLFGYYAGMHSAPVQLAARLFGVDPDRALGIETLKRAVDEAPYAWIEAAYVLSQIYLYIDNDPKTAFTYTDLLLRHYPENYDFNFMMGEELVAMDKLEEAREFRPLLETMISRSHPNRQREWELKYAALEAALAFKEGDRRRAMERCDWVIEHYEMEFDWHLGIARYIRGQCREFRGDLTGAREDYRVAVRLDNRTYIVKDARTALERIDRMMTERQ